MLNLDPNYVATLQKMLEAHFPEHVVWVYGSRIKDSAHEGSDLDLVIMDISGNTTAKQLSSLREDVSASNVPILVDILLWSEIPSDFRQEIEKKHEVFYVPLGG
jgi:predicted nucleotidyltransferase